MKQHPHLKLIIQWIFNTKIPVWVWRSGVDGLHDWQLGWDECVAHFGLDKAEPTVQQEPTSHCAEKNKPGGCQLHNLHCGYPACDTAPTPKDTKSEIDCSAGQPCTNCINKKQCGKTGCEKMKGYEV